MNAAWNCFGESAPMTRLTVSQNGRPFGSARPTSRPSHSSLILAKAQMPCVDLSPALTPHITTVSISPSVLDLPVLTAVLQSFQQYFCHVRTIAHLNEVDVFSC